MHALYTIRNRPLYMLHLHHFKYCICRTNHQEYLDNASAFTHPQPPTHWFSCAKPHFSQHKNHHSWRRSTSMYYFVHVLYTRYRYSFLHSLRSHCFSCAAILQQNWRPIKDYFCRGISKYSLCAIPGSVYQYISIWYCVQEV